MKFIIMGPVSLILLARVRLSEDVASMRNGELRPN